MSAGGDAIRSWSKTIFGTKGELAEWGQQVARMMEEGGPDVQLPPYPSRWRSTRESRDETARRIFKREEPQHGDR